MIGYLIYETQEKSIDHKNVTEKDIAYAKAQESLGSAMVSSKVLAGQLASALLSAGYTNMATIQNSQKSTGISVVDILA